MKYLLLPIVFFMLCLASCSTKGDSLTHDSAQRAAERYYGMLIHGEYEQYVSGIYGFEGMPEDQRSQMVDLMAQFMEGQPEGRKILNAVATSDSLQDSVAYVFLDILYGDSTTEHVGLPLVFHREQWWIQ